MIGVDTNVLVRAALDDEPKEVAIAQAFLKNTAEQNKLFISTYAILEMVWVLKVKGRTRHQISEAIFALVDSPGVVIAQREIILAALGKYQKGKADFGDYLIMAEGEAHRAHKLATFDKTLIKDNPHCEHPEKIY